MSDSEKVLTYEEAKELCKKAFDGGVTYGSESMRYSCNAVAYDWDHWIKKNEGLFRSKPTVEGVLMEFHERMDELGTTDQCVGSDRADAVDALLRERAELIAEYAQKLRLVEEDV